MNSLRPLISTDCERLHAWRSAPEVAKYMYSDHMFSIDEHTRWFEGARVDGANVYRVFVVDDVPSGLVSLTDIRVAHRSCSWGGYLAPTVERGKGLGAVAMELSLDLAFRDLQLNRVQLEVFADNDRAIAMYARIGFQIEARLREYVWKGEVARDVLGMSILQREWTMERTR